MGTLWNRSGIVERYADDIRASGAKAYFYEGGTTTFMTVYEDSGENVPHTNPVIADAYGRWPDVFIPYIVSYDVRVTDANDVQLTYSLEIPNPDPVDVSVTIPAEERVQTGMIHAGFTNFPMDGYVRLNGNTIGNAASGATERANADTADLFAHLWGALGNSVAPVSGGRGASAAADFAANKTIVLPSCQGASLVGLDTMGATAGGWFPDPTFAVGWDDDATQDQTIPGSGHGLNALTILTSNLPAFTTGGVQSGASFSAVTGFSPTPGTTILNTGRFRLVTWYIKL